MALIMNLTGTRAMQFRNSAIDVLVRFLRGDTTLHAELDDNAERQAALPANHPLEVLSSTSRGQAYIMLSPSMEGMYFTQFTKCPVAYLLKITTACLR